MKGVRHLAVFLVAVDDADEFVAQTDFDRPVGLGAVVQADMTNMTKRSAVATKNSQPGRELIERRDGPSASLGTRD